MYVGLDFQGSIGGGCSLLSVGRSSGSLDGAVAGALPMRLLPSRSPGYYNMDFFGYNETAWFG
ncbi:hypothetical protein Pfo_015081, partial [Paulownia fortunei]